jgi:hypothetical protein
MNITELVVIIQVLEHSIGKLASWHLNGLTGGVRRKV